MTCVDVDAAESVPKYTNIVVAKNSMSVCWMSCLRLDVSLGMEGLLLRLGWDWFRNNARIVDMMRLDGMHLVLKKNGVGGMLEGI